MNSIVKKVAVYPFYDEFIPVVKFLNKMNPEYKVCNVVSPMGFGLEGKDAGEAYRKNTIGLKVTCDFEKAIAESDVLFVAGGDKCTMIYKNIIDQMKKAIFMKKEVICTLELHQQEINELIKFSNDKSVKFTYYNTDKKSVLNKEKLKIENISTPIIYIGEIMEGFQGFEMLLRTTLYLKEQGYNVLSIGKPKYSNIFKIKSMPEFLYESGISEEHKIYGFNNYIYELENRMKPDVIVIQLPDNLLKYNKSITNHFGIYSYIVSQAVRGDYFIYCYQYDNSGPKMLEMLNEIFKYRFDFEIKAVSMDNKYIEARTDNISNNEIPLLWLEQAVVNDSIKRNYSESSIPVYNCENEKQSNQLFESMMYTLIQYGEVSSV